MMCILHAWGKWEDVRIGKEYNVIPLTIYGWTRETIRQQKRCSKCNLVKTRTS